MAPSQNDARSYVGLDEAFISLVIDEHEQGSLPALETLWTCYRNPTTLKSRGGGAARISGSHQRTRQALDAGLPDRIIGDGGLAGIASNGVGNNASSLLAASHREIVIENDIAWRIHAMVDFVFGKPAILRSTARAPALQEAITRIVDRALEASGGIAMLQDACLLAHVFGHVDFIIRPDIPALRERARQWAAQTKSAASTPNQDEVSSPINLKHIAASSDKASLAQAIDMLVEAAELIRIEPIDPRRGVAILDPSDYRIIRGYVIKTTTALNRLAGTAHARPTAASTGRADSLEGLHTTESPSLAERLARLLDSRSRTARTPSSSSTNWPRSGRRTSSSDRATAQNIETITAESSELRVIGESMAQIVRSEISNAWACGRVPIVHVQNISQPFAYSGLSDVEPLVPLVDELNTRLSDRANRVALQSFKMYLAKGIDGFEKAPVAPGAVWSTDNLEASITAFGGDADSPSETIHITEIREALDKVSGVPPLASGVIRAKLGNLTSATALRITLMGLIARTNRKRVAYERGLGEIARFVLMAFDHVGLLETASTDRGIKVVWQDPLPIDVGELVAASRAKAELGVPTAEILGELGYNARDQGVT